MTFIIQYLTKDNHYLSLIGIIIVFFIAFLFSKHKKKINIKRSIIALIIQIFIAFSILNTQIGQSIFHKIARGFSKLATFSDAGIKFIFGNLIDPTGSWGYLFAIKVLPIIIFFGALMALLYHLGIIQLFVKIISFTLSPILGTSGAETLAAAANSMLDPSASAILIKKHLKEMTDSEMLVLMIAGMSTLQAGLLVIYSSMGMSMIHLLTASIMSIPGAILISKILMPETQTPVTASGKSVKMERDTSNVLDAISSGTLDGLQVALNVGAILIVFISLMSMADFILKYFTGFTLNDIFAKLFYSVAYILGIVKEDRNTAATLLGQKLVINEFIAYANLAKTTITAKSKILLTYALCGFSNFSVIGILIGSIGTLEPSKRKFLTKYGLYALLGGTLVNLLNAMIANLLI